jgi:ABC-type phosphate transport system permease subunit
MHREVWLRRVSGALTIAALGTLLLLVIMLGAEGAPALAALRPSLWGAVWAPGQGQYGLGGLLLGSVLTVGLGLLLAAPPGIRLGAWLAELAPPTARRLVCLLVDGLATVPGVVLGLLGLWVLAPLIRACLGGPGLSLLAGALVLALAMLPTLVTLTAAALAVQPRAWRDGALALGATPRVALRTVLLPAARGRLTGVVALALGRGIGETMALVMVTGNAVALPHSPLDPVRTLTGNLVLEMAYATGLHRSALFVSGLLLLALTGLCLALAAAWRKGAGA